MKRDINFKNCKNVKDIETKIVTALEYEEVVSNRPDAQRWFKECDITGEVITHDIINEHVGIMNEDEGYESVYEVRVYEHFVTAGSNDYCYSYEIIKLY